MNEEFTKEVLLSLLDDPLGVRAHTFYNLKAFMEDMYQEKLPECIKEIFSRVKISDGRAFLYETKVNKEIRNTKKDDASNI
jgi:hypothetical protein